MALRGVTIVVAACVASISQGIDAGPMRPTRDSIVAQLERVGFSCGENAFGVTQCNWVEYPKPSFTVLLVTNAGRVKTLTFWTTAVDDTPILDVPDPMYASADLEFEGANPGNVREWLERCVGSVGPKPRPKPFRLGGGRYVCGGEPNAPGYSIHWK